MLTTNATISATKQFLFFSKIFTSLFHPYLSTKSSWQSPLTLPSSIPQLFFTNLFLRATIPTTYIKNIFPTANILEIQAASRDQELGSIVRTDTVVISPIFFKVWAVITRTTHNHWFSIAQTQKIGALQVRQTIQSTFSHILNLLSLLPYPTNTITRTQISLETSCLTWFSS